MSHIDQYHNHLHQFPALKLSVLPLQSIVKQPPLGIEDAYFLIAPPHQRSYPPFHGRSIIGDLCLLHYPNQCPNHPFIVWGRICLHLRFA